MLRSPRFWLEPIGQPHKDARTKIGMEAIRLEANIDDLSCAARNNPDEVSMVPNFNPTPSPNCRTVQPAPAMKGLDSAGETITLAWKRHGGEAGEAM